MEPLAGSSVPKLTILSVVCGDLDRRFRGHAFHSHSEQMLILFKIKDRVLHIYPIVTCLEG